MKLQIKDKIFVISLRTFDAGTYIWEITNIGVVYQFAQFYYYVEFDQILGNYRVKQIYLPKEDVDFCKDLLLYKDFKIFFTEKAFVNYLKNETESGSNNISNT